MTLQMELVAKVLLQPFLEDGEDTVCARPPNTRLFAAPSRSYPSP